MVLQLCEGTHGDGEVKLDGQEVRGLRAKATKLRATIGMEEAVVCQMREGARGVHVRGLAPRARATSSAIVFADTPDFEANKNASLF